MKYPIINTAKIAQLLSIFCLVTLLPVIVFAQPHWGGEITFESLINGNLRFTLKYYRNCQASYQIPDSIILNSNSPVTTIWLHIAPGYPKDISPFCDTNSALSHISCNYSPTNPNGSVQEFVFTSDVAYPNGVAISGNPPSTGWEFWYSSGGWRPTTINTNWLGSGIYIRSKIFSYINYSIPYDHAPRFESSIYNIFPAGYHFNYHPRGFDPELDSIAYSWGELKQSNGANAVFNTGYSYLNPLPGITHNPANIPATMNPKTGEISFKSYNTGIYYATQKVTSFRCGTKIAEIYRDMVFYIVDTSYNQLPLLLNNTGNSTDTFYAGENIHIEFALIDNQLQTNSDTQEVSYELFGLQFGTYIPGSTTSPPTLSKTSGCINPQCATMTPASNVMNPIFRKSPFIFSLDWQTDCCTYMTHIGCGNTTNKFDFVIKITDNFCPIPAFTYKTYSIIIEQMPWIDYPEINQISYDSGKIFIQWDPVIDSLNIFKEYYAYYYDKIGYLEECFDTTISISSEYILASQYSKPECFYIFPRGIGSNWLDTAKLALAIHNSIFLEVKSTQSDQTQLDWNPVQSWKTLQSNQYYRIYRKTQLNSTWQLIDSTQSTTWTDKTHFCGDSIWYKIGFKIITKNGISNYESFSNTPKIFHTDGFAPAICFVRDVAIDTTTGHASITFDKSYDTEFKLYIVYKLDYWGSFYPLDTIYGQNDTVYIDTTSTLVNLANKSFYKISVADICLNQSPMGGYVGIKTENQENRLRIIPNPASDKITLVIENKYDIQKIVQIDIFSTLGQLISSQSFNLELSPYELSVKELPDGLYVLRAKFNNQTCSTSRFLVQRKD